jgi:hypothetical protein
MKLLEYESHVRCKICSWQNLDETIFFEKLVVGEFGYF